jgi:hypothetical protein
LASSSAGSSAAGSAAAGSSAAASSAAGSSVAGSSAVSSAASAATSSSGTSSGTSSGAARHYGLDELIGDEDRNLVVTVDRFFVASFNGISAIAALVDSVLIIFYNDFHWLLQQ